MAELVATARHGAARRSVSDTVFVAAALAWAAAAIHGVAAVDHYDESHLFAALFWLSTALQVAAGVALCRRPTRGVLAGSVVLSVGIAAAWAMSRIVGLPIGPEHWKPEEIGALDVICTLDELALPVLVLAYVGRLPRAFAQGAIALGGALVCVSSVAFMVGHAH